MGNTARWIGWLAIAGLLSALDPRAARADGPALLDHYKRGMAAYALEAWDQAIFEFEAGFRADPKAVFLYDIAEAYRQSRRPAQAVEFYRKYLALAPVDVRDRGDVERRIVTLERAIESDKQARENRSPSSAGGQPPGDRVVASQIGPRAQQPLKYDVPAIGLLGAGGLSAVVGIVLAVYGEVIFAQANDHSTTLDLSVREALVRRSDGTGIAGYAALGAGVALLLAGGIEHALRPRSARVKLSIGGTPGGLSATVGGAF